MMKISKSKRQLAQLIIEAGVTKFPDGANWVAQDKEFNGTRCAVYMYVDFPKRCGNSWSGLTHSSPVIKMHKLIRNWHQTKLSRYEFDQIVAETAPDVDGWIEWKGVPRSPVSKDTQVDVKMQNGTQHFGRLIDDEYWSDRWGDASIIAYRLHKQQPKPEFCESVMRSIPEPEAQPTIEQLAADYRNKLDYSNRKQDEADKANMESDAALAQLEDAIAEIGFAITPLAETEKEPELVITDWRDLQVGDEVEVFNFECPERESRRKKELMSGPCVVMRAEGGNVRIELKKNLPTKDPHWNATGVDACEFKFIRRP